ncbi:MAG TPA: ion transporter [Candidatus Ozemobacteraceae bacterium]|nr:ion transporter [Candidatus Ozemobacteraceae bacterium]
MDNQNVLSGWRRTWHEIIFESDTTAGRAFDLLLIFCILASFGLVMLESLSDIEAEFGSLLRGGEWVFTVLFSVEYIMRLLCVVHPWKYVTSLLGLIDLMAVLPTYLGVLFPGARVLISLRILRLLRIFRILKLAHYLSEAGMLWRALSASKAKITVFLLTTTSLVTIIGSVMYVIEGPENGFTSIPVSIYWAIVTMTTVGFGDITPKTPLGQLFAGMVMILGYGIIAVPTGIFTAEMAKASRKDSEPVSSQCCMACAAESHDADAKFCKYCGAPL